MRIPPNNHAHTMSSSLHNHVLVKTVPAIQCKCMTFGAILHDFETSRAWSFFMHTITKSHVHLNPSNLLYHAIVENWPSSLTSSAWFRALFRTNFGRAQHDVFSCMQLPQIIWIWYHLAHIDWIIMQLSKNGPSYQVSLHDFGSLFAPIWVK